ncbi:MAG: PstS family phosphate ABC transporter substrate-binding protein [Magnetococcales bacterium]|nr:PstS family phosphate ABC transporter substrate-binding protein [Magnetococcales bacterium]
MNGNTEEASTPQTTNPAAIQTVVPTVIRTVGSETMVKLATAWARAYSEKNTQENQDSNKQNIVIQVQGGGTANGFAALLDGHAEIVNASQPLNLREIRIAQTRLIEPVRYLVGHDALIAIIIHPSNPLSKISLMQLAEIFGEDGRVHGWYQLGINFPACNNHMIEPIIRQNSSGTYSYFRETVLGEKLDYKHGVEALKTPDEIIDRIASAPCAIGYGSATHINDSVKTACVYSEESKLCFTPEDTTTENGKHPLLRPLYNYTNGVASGEIKRYLDWILSDEGQCIAVDNGYAAMREVDCETKQPE